MIKSVPYAARRRAVTITSATVDAGGTPTTKLRKNLLMAKLDADGKFGLYNSTSNLGLQIPVGVLENETNMIAGGAGDKAANIVEGGVWGDTEILNIERHARLILGMKGFDFRDATVNNIPTIQFGVLPNAGVRTVAGNTGVAVADDGLLFIATAAADFTLPAIALGLSFQFMMLANANLGVAGAANIIAKNNAAASLVRYSTASNLIGAYCAVRAIYNGTALRWLFSSLCDNTPITVT